MKTRFETGHEFIEFKEELKKRLAERQPGEIDSSGHRLSAVKLLLMNKDNEVRVLVTKRSGKVRTHKGEVSLPGGAFSEEDGHIINTAYRETYEEVGIPPEKIEYLGRFDDYISIAGFHVSCFVGAVDYPVAYTINTDEIEAYGEIPLSIFLNLEYDDVQTYNHKGVDYQVYYYNYGQFTFPE